MTRPHEDLERHTSVDHRGGGPPVAFAPGGWCAIDVAHVTPDRVDVGLSAYETLIEKAHASSAKAGAAVVLRSEDNRSVLALVEIDGHEGYGHLESAWDDSRLHAEHRAVATSNALGLYRVTARVGEAEIDPASTDAYGSSVLNGTPSKCWRSCPPSSRHRVSWVRSSWVAPMGSLA